MDKRTRELERQLAQEPDNTDLRYLLVAQHRRTGMFNLEPRDCEMPTRGIYEGEYFSCLQGVHLVHAILKRAESFNSRCYEYSNITLDEWLQRTLDLFTDEKKNDKKKVLFSSSMRFLECLFYPKLDMGYLPSCQGNPWREAEAIIEWGVGSFHWIKGEVRSSRHSYNWNDNNGRDVPGTSLVTIDFDWPRWFHRNYPSGPLVPSERYGQLPSCSILYENPTPEMKKLLCGIGSKFFNHRVLPDKPPLETENLAQPIDEYGDPMDIIPLHIRGELVLPTCEEMKANYVQQYPRSDGTKWPFNGVDVHPVSVKCPTCERVYSVFKDDDGGDTGNCFCEHCQITLIEPYANNLSHFRAFVAPHASYQLQGSGYGYNYPLYIPDDCPSELKTKIVEYFREKYGFVEAD